MPMPSLKKSGAAATPDIETTKVAVAPPENPAPLASSIGSKASASTATTAPPKPPYKAGTGAEPENSATPPALGPRLLAAVLRLSHLPIAVQAALAAALLVPPAWYWAFQPPKRQDAPLQAAGDFGPDGFPRWPVAHADRKVTEQDTANMFRQVSEQPRTTSPTEASRLRRRHAENAAKGARPRAAAASEAAAVPRSARVYGGGGTLKAPNRMVTDVASLPVGTRIAVVLDVGTSTAYRSTVMGRVTRDVVSPEGQILLAAGAFLKGRASGDPEAGRIYVDFDQAVVSGKTLRLQGYAVAHNEPGVVASKREITSQERQKASLADGVLETAKDVAGRVGEGVASTLTRNVAHGSLSQMQKDITSHPSYVLSLPAGAHFEVLVTG